MSPTHEERIKELKKLIASGNFHHATYRTDFARGLHIYSKDQDGFRGFRYFMAFSESLGKEKVDEAYTLVKNTGVYEGSYK
jgi:hypothetical protein